VLRSGGIAYGPGSARGVINIITKKAKKKRLVETFPPHMDRGIRMMKMRLSTEG